MDKQHLCKRAIDAMKFAYATYSGCHVGAALLCSNGGIFTGCKIENASYSLTVCAERTALFKAVSEGRSDFEAIAVAGGRGGRPERNFPPCGVCRQVLSEFCPPDMPVLMVYSETEWEEHTLGELLPLAFDLRKSDADV